LFLEIDAKFACKLNYIAVSKRMAAGALDIRTVDPGAVGAAAVLDVVLAVFGPDIDVLPGYVRDLCTRHEFLKVMPAE